MIVIAAVLAVCFLPLCYTSVYHETGNFHKPRNQGWPASFPKTTQASIGTVSRRDLHKYGYVLGLSYVGQQGAGIQALMSLQCFIGSVGLPMQILEPVITATKFESHHTIDSQSPSTSFSDIFDITHFNLVSKSNGLASLASMKEFVADAPKVVILVITKRQPSYGRRKAASSLNVIWSSDNTSHCYQPNNSMPSLPIFVQSGGYCIQRVVSIVVFQNGGRSTELFTETNFYDTLLGPYRPREVTLIFDEWRTPWYVSKKLNHKSSECQEMKLKSKKAQFRPSPHLLADVKYYKERFLNSSNSLAIMLRMERMLLLFQRRQDVENQIQKCLGEVVNIASDIWKRKKQHRTPPMVTLDLGKYGSGSWESSIVNGKSNLGKITKLAKEALSTLFNHQWSFEKWETSFMEAAKGHENSGYIAAIQRTLASQAECLVLAGGGNFQELAMRDYMRNHPDKGSWCIHLVCAINEEQLKTEIMQSLTALRFDSL